MFTQKPLAGLRLIFLMLISVALMVWNYQHPAPAQHWREKLSLFTAPIVAAANTPLVLFDHIAVRLRSQDALLRENVLLHKQVLMLSGQLQKFNALQTENQTLRELLQSAPVMNHLKLQLARVMAVQLSPYVQEIILNKGKQDGVFVGQPVLDAHGIMGKVIETTPYTARVLLLIDTRSGIPVENERTGLRGILVGEGASGMLRIDHMPLTSDMQPGDVLISSGIGGQYPAGYPAGEVVSINRHTNDQFLGVKVKPLAKMHSSDHVLLIKGTP